MQKYKRVTGCFYNKTQEFYLSIVKTREIFDI